MLPEWRLCLGTENSGSFHSQHLGPFFQRTAGRTNRAPATTGRKTIYKDEGVGMQGFPERGGNIHSNWTENAGRYPSPSPCEGQKADLPTAPLLTSLASLGSSLRNKEHASNARITASVVP